METIVCKSCKRKIKLSDYRQNLNICPQCGYYGLVPARSRIEFTVDEGSFEELAADIKSDDFLNFADSRPYGKRLEEARKKAGINEAIITGHALLGEREVSVGVMDFAFMGGSMGSVVGEKIKILSQYSLENKIPLIVFSASGGARMQEGILSLMQMAKTVSCMRRLSDNRIPFFSVITNPTTGGVSASFASIADIIMAEPGALFCFAGPRVVKQTIKKELPEDFGTAERDIENGQIDMIVERKKVRDTLIKLLGFF